MQSESLKSMLISLGSTNPELRSHIRPLLEIVERGAEDDVQEQGAEDDVQYVIDWAKGARLRAAAIPDKDARLDAYSGIITDMIVELSQCLAKDLPIRKDALTAPVNTRLARLSDEYSKT